MPILVTGGAGFIGRRVVARLLAAGQSVTVVDDLSATGAPPPPQPGLCFHHGDIRDAAVMTRLCADADVILHLAALHHIPTCRREPRRALDINILGTQTLLDAAHHARLIVLASTGGVYDWLDRPLTEEDPVAPRDTYTLSKAANETQGRVWAGAHPHRRLRIARLFNVLGAGDPHGHLVPDILSRLAATTTGQVPVGNLSSRRDYLHVSDIAAGLVRLLGDEDPSPAEIYNLCSGREATVADIVRLLAQLRGQQAEAVLDPALARPQDRPSQLGNPSKAWQRLGWGSQVPLEDALRDAIADNV